jgi:hypothetical protein
VEKNVLRNQAALGECEAALVRSGEAFFTADLLGGPPLAKNAEKDAYRRLTDMLRLYWCMGYLGELREESFGKDKATVQQLRLEAARLEEKRLNRCGLADTYKAFPAEAQASTTSADARFPLGFLRGADISQNAMFERLYRNVASLSSAPTTLSLERVREILGNASEDAPLCALEVLLLSSLRDYPGDEPRTTDSARSSIVAVEVRLRFKNFFSAFISRALPKRVCNNLVSRVFTAFTVEKMKSMLDRLVSFEYLKISWAVTPVSCTFYCGLSALLLMINTKCNVRCAERTRVHSLLRGDG